MAGKDFQGRGMDVIDDINRRFAALERNVKLLQSNTRPTMPGYNFQGTEGAGDFPLNPVEGQVAVGRDTNKLHFFVNGEWRTIADVQNVQTDWLIVNGHYVTPGSASPPATYGFPTAASGTSSRFQVKIVGSDDDVDGTYLSSDGGKYTIDSTGIISLPDGLWYFLGFLQISTSSTVSSTSLASFGMDTNGLGNITGGTWRRNSPSINNLGGFHNWHLTSNNFLRVGGSIVSFSSQCDAAIRSAASINADLNVSFFKITDEYPTIVI